MKEKLKFENYNLAVILGLTLLFNAGFFDYSVAICGAAICVCLFVRLIQKKEFYRRDQRLVFAIPVVLLGISVVVSLWAVDVSENLLGAMRLAVLCLWMRLVRCSEEEEQTCAKNCVPFLGAAMIAVSVAAYFISSIRNSFWENGRLAGFFQYANTCALFLLAGVILVLSQQQKKVERYGLLMILLAGILLTGSRSVLLLGMIWAGYHAFRERSFRKPFLAGGAIFLILGGIVFWCTGSTKNITRIFSIFQSNSTIWGRILYARDAVILLMKKFYGLGRMGYYYSQGTFQSGVYHVRFVHNDFLQAALDYGVLAFLLLLIFAFWQLFRGKQASQEKELLIVLCLAGCMDFHFQYLLMGMIAMLLLDYGKKEREKKRELVSEYAFLPVCCCVFVYLAIATGSAKAGRTDLALSMLPDYTYAQEKAMKKQMGTEESYELAEKIIQKNSYDLSAYIVRGTVSASYFQVEDCIADFNRVIELDPYNVTYYAQYDRLLGSMEEQLAAMGETDTEQVQLIQERRKRLPSDLAAMEKRTSRLAYKIKDMPQFTYLEAQDEEN